jgi:hypothetical protein
MPKKYIKGKDGKFKGSLPDPTMLPKAATIPHLPTLPTNTAKPLESITGGLSGNPALVAIPKTKLENKETSSQLSLSQEPEGLVPAQPSSSPEPLSSFYVSSQDIDFQIPEAIARKVERGDMAYFSEEHLLYTDSYGDNNASHYPAFPQNPEDLIDLATVRNGEVAENINSATSYSELNSTVKSYFTDGGCAALALEIHNRLPGSKLGIVVSAMIDDPSDATAAHVYVSKDGKILDGYGITGLAEYDYQNAAGTDPDFMEVYAYDATPETVQALIQHGCFGNNFNEESKGLIGKVAELVIGEKG